MLFHLQSFSDLQFTNDAASVHFRAAESQVPINVMRDLILCRSYSDSLPFSVTIQKRISKSKGLNTLVGSYFCCFVLISTVNPELNRRFERKRLELAQEIDWDGMILLLGNVNVLETRPVLLFPKTQQNINHIIRNNFDTSKMEAFSPYGAGLCWHFLKFNRLTI